MNDDYEWLRTGSEDLISLVRKKGEGDLRDPQTGARYPKKDLMDIYGYLVKRCVEDPWDETLYGILRMVAGVLDIPLDAQRRLHTEAMLNPFMISRDSVDKAMLRELERVYLKNMSKDAPARFDEPGYGLNFFSEADSLENLQTSSRVLMEVEKGSLISEMLTEDLGPSTVDSSISLDTMDRKRPMVFPKPPPTKPGLKDG